MSATPFLKLAVVLVCVLLLVRSIFQIAKSSHELKHYEIELEILQDELSITEEEEEEEMVETTFLDKLKIAFKMTPAKQEPVNKKKAFLNADITTSVLLLVACIVAIILTAFTPN
jgi:hypothetical protein